jgi:alanyl-tRNA synthetase
LQDKLQPAVIVLASVADGKIALISAVSKDLHGQVKAGELIGKVAGAVGGKGGGRPDMAQAGGSDVEALPSVLAVTKEELLARLS